MKSVFFNLFYALFPTKQARHFGWLLVALIGFAIAEGIVQTIRWCVRRRSR